MKRQEFDIFYDGFIEANKKRWLETGKGQRELVWNFVLFANELMGKIIERLKESGDLSQKVKRKTRTVSKVQS